MDSRSSVAAQWRLLCLQHEAAKHYHTPYALIAGRSFRNPLIEHLLPELLFVKALAVLDGGLCAAIEEQEVRKSQRPGDLFGRITYLASSGRLANQEALHSLRIRRRAAAHELGSTVTWTELEDAVLRIEAALQELGLVGHRPELEFFGERSQAVPLEGEEGWRREFVIGVKENGRLAYEARWTEEELPPDIDER